MPFLPLNVQRKSSTKFESKNVPPIENISEIIKGLKTLYLKALKEQGALQYEVSIKLYKSILSSPNLTSIHRHGYTRIHDKLELLICKNLAICYHCLGSYDESVDYNLDALSLMSEVDSSYYQLIEMLVHICSVTEETTSEMKKTRTINQNLKMSIIQWILNESKMKDKLSMKVLQRIFDIFYNIADFASCYIITCKFRQQYPTMCSSVWMSEQEFIQKLSIGFSSHSKTMILLHSEIFNMVMDPCKLIVMDCSWKGICTIFAEQCQKSSHHNGISSYTLIDLCIETHHDSKGGIPSSSSSSPSLVQQHASSIVEEIVYNSSSIAKKTKLSDSNYSQLVDVETKPSQRKMTRSLNKLMYLKENMIHDAEQMLELFDKTFSPVFKHLRHASFHWKDKDYTWKELLKALMDHLYLQWNPTDVILTTTMAATVEQSPSMTEDHRASELKQLLLSKSKDSFVGYVHKMLEMISSFALDTSMELPKSQLIIFIEYLLDQGRFESSLFVYDRPGESYYQSYFQMLLFSAELYFDHIQENDSQKGLEEKLFIFKRLYNSVDFIVRFCSLDNLGTNLFMRVLWLKSKFHLFCQEYDEATVVLSKLKHIIANKESKITNHSVSFDKDFIKTFTSRDDENMHVHVRYCQYDPIISLRTIEHKLKAIRDKEIMNLVNSESKKKNYKGVLEILDIFEEMGTHQLDVSFLKLNAYCYTFNDHFWPYLVHVCLQNILNDAIAGCSFDETVHKCTLILSLVNKEWDALLNLYAEESSWNFTEDLIKHSYFHAMFAYFMFTKNDEHVKKEKCIFQMYLLNSWLFSLNVIQFVVKKLDEKILSILHFYQDNLCYYFSSVFTPELFQAQLLKKLESSNSDIVPLYKKMTAKLIDIYHQVGRTLFLSYTDSYMLMESVWHCYWMLYPFYSLDHYGPNSSGYSSASSNRETVFKSIDVLQKELSLEHWNSFICSFIDYLLARSYCDLNIKAMDKDILGYLVDKYHRAVSVTSANVYNQRALELYLNQTIHYDLLLSNGDETYSYQDLVFLQAEGGESIEKDIFYLFGLLHSHMKLKKTLCDMEQSIKYFQYDILCNQMNTSNKRTPAYRLNSWKCLYEALNDHINTILLESSCASYFEQILDDYKRSFWCIIHLLSLVKKKQLQLEREDIGNLYFELAEIAFKLHSQPVKYLKQIYHHKSNMLEEYHIDWLKFSLMGYTFASQSSPEHWKYMMNELPTDGLNMHRHFYMLGKAWYKCSSLASSSSSPILTSFRCFKKASEIASEVSLSLEDKIADPSYKMQSCLYKAVKRDVIQVGEHLNTFGFENMEHATKQDIYRLVIQRLNDLRLQDKKKYEHRLTYRIATIWYEGLENKSKALSELSSLFNIKSGKNSLTQFNIWKTPTENAGLYYYYTKKYSELFIKWSCEMGLIENIYPFVEKWSFVKVHFLDSSAMLEFIFDYFIKCLNATVLPHVRVLKCNTIWGAETTTFQRYHDALVAEKGQTTDEFSVLKNLLKFIYKFKKYPQIVGLELEEIMAALYSKMLDLFIMDLFISSQDPQESNASIQTNIDTKFIYDCSIHFLKDAA